MQIPINPRTLAPFAVAFSMLAAGASAQASAPATSSSGSGLLGTRYVEAGTFAVDYQNYEDNSFGVGTTVNVPVASSIDVGATFEHTQEEGDSSENFQDLSAYATWHTTFGELRPFARAELGYEWWHVSDDAFYEVSVGAEYSVTERLSVSGSVGWSEYLSEDWNGGEFFATARANWWFTDTLAGSLNGTAYEGGTWSYGAALVVRF